MLLALLLLAPTFTRRAECEAELLGLLGFEALALLARERRVREPIPEIQQQKTIFIQEFLNERERKEKSREEEKVNITLKKSIPATCIFGGHCLFGVSWLFPLSFVGSVSHRARSSVLATSLVFIAFRGGRGYGRRNGLRVVYIQ